MKMQMQVLLLLVVLLSLLQVSSANKLKAFLPGRGCGTVTPITTIEKVPDGYDEGSGIGCAFVEDEESFEAYTASRPSMYLQNYHYK